MDDLEWANKARKWSTQSRESAPWYQREEIGYDCRMRILIAGILRGQLPIRGRTQSPEESDL